MVVRGFRVIAPRTYLLPLFGGGYGGLWGGMGVMGLGVYGLGGYASIGTLTLICVKYLLFSILSRSLFLVSKPHIIPKKRK